MNNDDRDNDNKLDERHTDDTVARLMSLAGPRADIPAERQQRVHREVQRAWLQSTRTRTAYRWALPLALAASLVIAINIGTQQAPAPAAKVGEIAYVTGAGNRYSEGDAVYAGDVLQTAGTEGMSVMLPGDISLRIAADASLRFDTADELTLLHGLIYADTGDRIYRQQHLTVHTEAGSATDIGTQFSLAYVDDRLSVAVREGRVDIAANDTIHSANAGQKLVFAADGGPQRAAVLPYDESWDWASELAPGFDITDRSVMDFLKWAARETGRELNFANDELRIAAMNAKLYGSIADVTPTEAISSVLATTRFRYQVDAKSITILE